MTALRKNDIQTLYPYSCPICEKRGNDLRKLYHHLVKDHLWTTKAAEKCISEIELNEGLF